MILSIIFWVLAGSAVLWVVLFDLLVFSWVFALVKKLIWGSATTKTEKTYRRAD